MHRLHELSLLLATVLLVRLWHQGLRQRYPAFFAAWAFEVLSTAVLFFTPPRSNLYAELFFVCQSIALILNYFVLRELCMLVFHDHPGIEAAVRIGVRISLGLAAVIPLAILAATKLKPDAPFPLLELYFLVYQAGSFFLTILLAGTVVFVAWFPVALRRNIVSYALGFSLRLVGASALLLLRNSTALAGWREFAGTSSMCIDMLTVLFWIIWLNRDGEASRVSLGRSLRASDAEAAVRQLEGLNRTLSKALSKKTDNPEN